jgi:hypothetical protein
VQPVPQAVPEQAKGKQVWVWLDGQLPVPLQDAARLASPFVQVGTRHWLELAG